MNDAGGGLKVLLLKIVLLGIIDAIALSAIFILVLKDNLVVAVIVGVVTALINWIYFQRGALPAKYLTPGIIFLMVFQVFVVGYTAYIGFTNYGTGHNGTKEQAIESLLLSTQERVPDSPAYSVAVVEQLGVLSFLVTDPDGDVSVGNADNPLAKVTDADVEGGVAVGLPGYTTLNFSQILQRQDEIFALAVPLSDDPNDGSIRTGDGSTGYVYTSKLLYDADADTMTDTSTGVVYGDSGSGSFTDPDGKELLPGWRVDVGFDNFAKAFSTESIRGPFVSVLIWTFVFAFGSMALTFIFGLFLALMFNDARMKGRKFYRILVILPYAFPAFLGALVWRGMLTQDFGYINQVLLGGAEIPWLTDPLLAKLSLLGVNLWLGFPYMFLVTTGALQAIPEDMQEAARVDGATAWQIFLRIKFPLLMVAVAPLLIATFAFNFNNFNLIYMLTNGGPRDPLAGVNVGATDILISMVYKVAFDSPVVDYGLASAFTILIFIIVAVISIISFRRTKVLEELN